MDIYRCGSVVCEIMLVSKELVTSPGSVGIIEQRTEWNDTCAKLYRQVQVSVTDVV